MKAAANLQSFRVASEWMKERKTSETNDWSKQRPNGSGPGSRFKLSQIEVYDMVFYGLGFYGLHCSNFRCNSCVIWTGSCCFLPLNPFSFRGKHPKLHPASIYSRCMECCTEANAISRLSGVLNDVYMPWMSL